jgi:anti-sigma factor RsiW
MTDDIETDPRRAEIEALLPFYANGRISAADKARVEKALATDPELAMRLEIIARGHGRDDPAEREPGRALAACARPADGRDRGRAAAGAAAGAGAWRIAELARAMAGGATRRAGSPMPAPPRWR